MPRPTPYESRPIGGFESSSDRPYRISVTTQDTRQHLTETTQHKSAAVRYANHRPDYHPPRITQNPHLKYRFTPITTLSPVTHNSIVESGPPPATKAVKIPLRNLNTTSLTILLKKLKEANHLPPSFSAENVDNSITTLAKILNNLKKSKTRPQQTERPAVHPVEATDYDQSDEEILNEKHNAGSYSARATCFLSGFHCFRSAVSDQERNAWTEHGQAGRRLPDVLGDPADQLQLQGAAVQGLLRRSRDELPGVALLRPERRTGVIPVSERNHFQPGETHFDIQMATRDFVLLLFSDLN